MASLTRWTWVWVNPGSWWWTGRPGVLRFMGLQRFGHNWATELNWTELVVWICKPTFVHILEPKPMSSCLQQNIFLSYSWFSTLNSLYYKSQIVFSFLCHSLVAIQLLNSWCERNIEDIGLESDRSWFKSLSPSLTHFLQHLWSDIRHCSASRHLYLLFSLPGTFFPRLVPWLVFSLHLDICL